MIDLAALKELVRKATPLPWEFGGNVPFYVDMRKPAPSMSKHNEDRPSYWRYEDGAYAAAAINELPKLIEELEKLRSQVKNICECSTCCVHRDLIE